MKKRRKIGHSIFGIPGILFLLFFTSSLTFQLGSCDLSQSSPDSPPMDAPRPMDDDYFPERIEGYFMCSSPKTMEVNTPDDFEVWITRDSIRDLSFFKENLSDNDSALVEKIRVGHVMEVNLLEADTSARNFSIQSLSSNEQILDIHDPVIWKWKVTPVRQGTHNLIVVAKIKMMNESLQVIGYKDLPVIERAIQVVVAPSASTGGSDREEPVKEKNYYWLIVFPLTGIIMWFFFRKKYRHKKRFVDYNEFREFRSVIEDLISKDRIEESFTAFERFLQKNPSKKIEQELIQLKSNYSNNQSRFNRNLVDNNEFNLNRSKVINGLLETVNQLNIKGDTEEETTHGF